jgi:oligogalacturonide lyase
MSPQGRRGRSLTRRALLCSAAALAPVLLPAQSGRGRTLEPDWGKYPDPSTEFEVLRLSGVGYETWMPPIPARAVTRRNSEILVASTRTGSMQLHRLELANGKWKLLTEAEALNRTAATLSADDRQVFFADGNRLVATSGGLRDQELFAAPGGSVLEGPLAPTEDGTALFFSTRSGETATLWRMRLPKAAPEKVVEESGAIVSPTPNPRRATVLWLNAAGECWTAAFDGSGRRKVESPAGRVQQAFWSPDGRELLYLLDPGVYGEAVQIRTYDIDSRTDKLVAKTSQFARFAPNANATVFLGASRSKASPSMLLMLRVTRRELTLCEHKASEPEITAPRFTFNSQRVLFESDRHGKPAIYTMSVDRLVEKTDS